MRPRQNGGFFLSHINYRFEDGAQQMTRQMTGAEMVVQALIDQGVDTVFGYPGGAVLPIYDA
ncbi:MAG: thiamine pyrophosphate-binding protein, partial [Ascidiaceihabitans sp.]|nr:thiamine pyrophosphate-binding protein [Ascidiaceihabitans sp.]